MAKDNNLVLYFSLLVLLLLLILLFQAYNSKCKVINYEQFSNNNTNVSKSVADIYNEQNTINSSVPQDMKYSPSDPVGSPYKSIESNAVGSGSSDATSDNNVSCFPRDSLTAKDLLPKDAEAVDSKWANMNPSTGGSINDPNLLTAGWTVGINSVQNSLRNANLQLRSEPPNPQQPVSPWMISTIGPDTNRRDMEIGSQPYWE